MHTNHVILYMLLCASLFAPGCDGMRTQSEESRQEAMQKMNDRKVYIPKNDLEFNNYNRRSVLADDPTAILWCTSAFPIPGSPLFTIPIVGKLTSGAKRPYQTTQAYGGASGQYYPELPGPDGMLGSSGEYRYGFTPGGIYADWYGMAVFCTTEPMVWQRESTTIVMQADPVLQEAQVRARAVLKRGTPADAAEASRILEDSIKSVMVKPSAIPSVKKEGK